LNVRVGGVERVIGHNVATHILVELSDGDRE